MLIGILSESEGDFGVFSVLCKRLLQEVVDPIDFVSYAASGPIIGKLEAASISFFITPFNDDPRADLAIYFSDLDNNPTKKLHILNWAKEHCTTYPDRIIVPCFASPHFEQWFFDEIDNLRAVLPDLPLDIPYQDCQPKERLRRIIQKYADLSTSSGEVKILLAENINLNSLKLRNSDFNSFSNELLTAIRRVQNL